MLHSYCKSHNYEGRLINVGPGFQSVMLHFIQLLLLKREITTKVISSCFAIRAGLDNTLLTTKYMINYCLISFSLICSFLSLKIGFILHFGCKCKWKISMICHMSVFFLPLRVKLIYFPQRQVSLRDMNKLPLQQKSWIICFLIVYVVKYNLTYLHRRRYGG